MRAETATMEAGGTRQPATIRVWDPLVRISHWLLVGLFAFAFVSSEDWGSLHRAAGYTILGLLVIRILWGFAGPRHARFSDFLYPPREIAGFIKDSLAMKARRYIGHNPAGGIMVIALIISIATACVTGYMMTTDRFWGVEWVNQIHALSAYGTVVLACIHVAGVVLASLEHRENLVLAMLTGRKRKQ
jgi:cytochrome b